MTKDLFNMKLHETLVINSNLEILRIPGGWIYNFKNNGTCRVPFSLEFKEIRMLNKTIKSN